MYSLPLLQGSLTPPGDKSISHRAVMLGSLAEGTTEIHHFLSGEDCLSTIRCFQKMGIAIETKEDLLLVHGKGLHGLTRPEQALDCGNSGTTMRLLAGILAGQSFSSVLTGDPSLSRRPMDRILLPLTQMRASISGQTHPASVQHTAPLAIEPSALHGISYTSPIASAQVKSCILLAGMYADSPTKITEPVPTRDHTERMLASFDAAIRSVPSGITLEPEPALTACRIDVPGDLSSAAYFLVAASLLPGSEVILKQVGINPTRDGILRILQDMGAEISVENVLLGGEPAADLVVRGSHLHGVEIGGDIIPSLIDEIPVLAVAATQAEGETVIRDAAELKEKESDRIRLVVDGLRSMGADIASTEDGMIIRGGKPLHGAAVETAGDHRLAMAFTIAGLFTKDGVECSDAACVAVSYPSFFRDLHSLMVTDR